MKRKKLILQTLFTLLLIASVFLESPPISHAQTDQDWSEPVNLSLSGTASNPIVVIDLGGTFHAIWMDIADNAEGEYKYSQSPDGKSWSQAQTVQYPFGEEDQAPVLLADENGSIHVFWISGDHDLFYGQATPSNFANPRSWRTTSRLARDVLAFDVILDNSGALHIAYVRNSTTVVNPAGIYYRKSIIGGGFWSEGNILYETEYFRSARQNDVYVRISSSGSPDNQKIFVTWDNRAQKRVFMAVSGDSGANWGNAQQVKGPDDTGGIDTPFNLTVSAFDNNVLLIWQVGEYGSSNCTVYSQWSTDGGISWGDIVAVLGGRSECPLSTKIIGRNGVFVSVLFSGQLNPILIAWNGLEWSDIQTQTELPSFTNPLTFDAIILGCRFDLIKDGQLYVAGCDQGRGKDVWFLSRTLEPVENWFSPSAVWGEPIVLVAKSKNPERISNFHTTRDVEGNIHALWVQSPVGQGNQSGMTIKYARWDGLRWSAPESVITSLNGMPVQLMVTSDSIGRLLLSWIDGYNGDLVFTWADLERANLASGWVTFTGLPVPSRLINSSDMVVDGSGRIINVYDIPINEDRGVYLTQSADSGKNWSSPVRVFDAVSNGWEIIETPRISIGSDGALHLVFVRNTVRVGQTVGLYYTRSIDGGETWSDAQLLSEGDIQWTDIVSYGDGTVHVVWQEFDGLVFANISQISQDGGITWGKKNNVTGVNEIPTIVTLASDGRGSLHFVQLADQGNRATLNQEELSLQDWKWDGTRWDLELAKDFLIKGKELSYSLSAEISSNGYLSVFMPVEYTDASNSIKSEVLTFSRYLDDVGNNNPLEVPIIPTVSGGTGIEEPPALQPTPTPDFSVLYNNNDAISPLRRNITGLALIGVGVIATFFLLLRRRPNIK